jgi:hypothetical protein
MSKLVQIHYDTNCYDSYNSQTCINLFIFNMIWIVTIHMILKHVWTCSDSIWYKLLQLIWFSNMSKLVQIHYDTNCYNSYDSQTCLNLFRFNMIRIVTIHMILKHVWTCSDSIWYELLRFIWFSNMSELVQNHYDTNWHNS